MKVEQLQLQVSVCHSLCPSAVQRQTLSSEEKILEKLRDIRKVGGSPEAALQMTS